MDQETCPQSYFTVDARDQAVMLYSGQHEYNTHVGFYYVARCMEHETKTQPRV